MSDREFASFDEAKRAAFLEDLMGHFHGRDVDLLPFGEVRERLHLKQLVDRGIQEVSLDRIVGSLGREREFTRGFFPREEALRERWQELKELAEGSRGFPPVELYYVNDVYFVVDGHHRVSVAKSLGSQTIEARVKEFRSPIKLTPQTSLEEVLLKSNLADFLETTGLVQELPGDCEMTIPNGYEILLDHISVHRYYLGIEKGSAVSWDEAVRSWRDIIYRPMVEIIKKHGIQEWFPGRTETDLYLFTMDHLHYLREKLAPKDVLPEQAVKHFKRLQKVDGERQKKSQSWWKKKPKKN